MKEKKLMDYIKSVVGTSDNVLIIAHENGQCRSLAHGNVEDLAKALFCCMHDKKNENGIGDFLFKILTLNVMNIINSESKYAADLMSAISNITESKFHEIQSKTTKKIDPKLLN